MRSTDRAIAAVERRRRPTSRGSTSSPCPATLLFVVFIAYPILWVAGQSLYAGASGGAAFAGLANYYAVLADPTFWIVVRNMVLWGVITIPVQMLIGGVLAYFIERHTHRAARLLPHHVLPAGGDLGLGHQPGLGADLRALLRHRPGISEACRHRHDVPRRSATQRPRSTR